MTTTPDDVSIEDYVATVQHELMRASDRAAAVLAGAYLDAMLERVLKHCLVAGKVTEKLFDQDGPLATFSSRIKLAYSLGLLSEPMYADLELVRKIRNHFAHHIRAQAFAESPARDWLSALWLPSKNLPGSPVKGRPELYKGWLNATVADLLWEFDQILARERRRVVPDPRPGPYGPMRPLRREFGRTPQGEG